MDDVYVFGADGSFSLELGDQTWLETWQSDAEACGTPVAPHDGSGTYSYTYVAGETITINGAGAYIGIAKAGNTYAYESNGVPTSIIYTVESLNAAKTAMTIAVQVTKDDGGIDYWTYQLVKGDSAAVTDPVVVEDEDEVSSTLVAGDTIDFNDALLQGDIVFTQFGGTSTQFVQDPTDATKTVASTTKAANAEEWAGTTMDAGEVVFPVTATATTISVRVYAPAAGMVVRLKLEESGDATHSVETDALTTVANAWETLTFDFSNPAEGTAALDTSYIFDTVSIFFNKGVSGADAGELIFYWDSFTWVGVAPVAAGTELVTNGNFQAGSASWLNADAAITSYFAVDVASAGDVWSVNLSQVMTLTGATSYDVSFKAKGSVARDMVAGLGLNANPYSAATETVSLTTEWTTFTYTITTTTTDGVDFGDTNSRVLFDMGGAVGQVWIDDVSVKLTGGDETELLTNGDFQAGSASWLNADAAITSYFAVDVASAGDVWSVNLSQVMTLTGATSYDLSFKAKGSVARDMVAGLGLNANPYSAATETVSLTTEWQTFTYTITTTTADGVDFGDSNSRVLFDMGGAVGQVWIDDVSVK
jgi:hypothetical protein